MHYTDFKYKDGQIINGLLLTNPHREIIKGHSTKVYDYICLNDKYKSIIKEVDLNRNRGCPVCSGKRIVKGINDLWTTDPKVAKLLKNPEDGYIVSNGSHKKLEFVCPYCHSTVIKIVKDVVKYSKVCCNLCSDNKSVPEKFVANILNELKIEYITELSKTTFPWIENYRYDFYIPLKNMIIELQGAQHFTDTFNGKSVKEQQNVDKKKMELAINNSITTYMQIDCSDSSYEFLSMEIMYSAFGVLFDLSNVDLKECYKKSQKSLLIKSVELWNSGMLVKDIAKELNLYYGTISGYLKRANSIGLCEYDKHIAHSRAAISNSKKNNIIHKTKKVYCVTTNEYFLSIKDAQNKYENASHIGMVCIGKRKTSGKYNGKSLIWRYWTEDEIVLYEEGKLNVCIN